MDKKIDNIHTPSKCYSGNTDYASEPKSDFSGNTDLLFHLSKHTRVVPSKDIKWYRVKYKRKGDL